MLKASGLAAERLARYRAQGLLDRAADIMRREGLNEHDAWERAVMADVRENATPEQVDAIYGAGAHDEILAAAAPENGVARQTPGAQGRVAHDGEIGAPKVSRFEAGRAGTQDEPARGARTSARERAQGQDQVGAGVTPTRALARDDYEQSVDKWREVRKPLPINTSAQRKDVIRGYKRELSQLGLLNAKAEGEVRNRLMGRQGESPEAANDIIAGTGAAPPGAPPPSAMRTADPTEPRPQGGVFDSGGSATLAGEVESPGGGRGTQARVRDKAGGPDPASSNDTHGAPSGAVSASGEPSGRRVANEPALAAAEDVAPKSADLALTYMPGWTAAQRASAAAKAQILNDGETVVRQIKRSGKSAASRYRRSGGHIPADSDVDHAIDLQLSGSDTVENMWPLNSSVNRSFGPQIRHRIKNLQPGTVINKVTIGDR